MILHRLRRELVGMTKKAVKLLTSLHGISESAVRPESAVKILRINDAPDPEALNDYARLQLAKLFELESIMQRAARVAKSSSASAKRKKHHAKKARQAERIFSDRMSDFASLYLFTPRSRHDVQSPEEASQRAWRRYITAMMARALSS